MAQRGTVGWPSKPSCGAPSEARGGRGPAQQPPRSQGEDRGHQEKDQDELELPGEPHDPQRLEDAEEDRPHQRAEDVAHPADHHHHERLDDDGGIHHRGERLARDLERSRHAGQPRSDDEHAGEEPGLVDAQRARHLAIGGRGADQDPPPGVVQDPPQTQGHRRSERQDGKIVGGNELAQHENRPVQAGRLEAHPMLRPPEEPHHVAEDQHQREGEEQLVQLRRPIHPAQESDLHDPAEERHAERREQHAA